MFHKRKTIIYFPLIFASFPSIMTSFYFQVNLYSGALFLEDSMDWSMFVSITLLVLMTGVLTVTGWFNFDLLQAIFLIESALRWTHCGYVH